eukprot:TRINITY_DN30995_c0_g1_i1.p1 TRINITY_DN30995_c0_g1~~TRINITY_DN30995_c0_g1_i1.p1  ORF type:complete len:413 (-),score=49.31 TRINITY_DN30995_c0_g1_i1:168-1406(-)
MATLDAVLHQLSCAAMYEQRNIRTGYHGGHLSAVPALPEAQSMLEEMKRRHAAYTAANQLHVAQPGCQVQAATTCPEVHAHVRASSSTTHAQAAVAVPQNLCTRDAAEMSKFANQSLSRRERRSQRQEKRKTAKLEQHTSGTSASDNTFGLPTRVGHPATLASAADVHGHWSDAQVDILERNGHASPVKEVPPAPSLRFADHGPWLARHLCLGNDQATQAEDTTPSVLINMNLIWRHLRESLPQSLFGVGPYTQHLGVAMGRRTGRVLELLRVELCPHVFSWEPSASSGPGTGAMCGIASLVDGLHRALEEFLVGSFTTWVAGVTAAAESDLRVVAMLVCNDGDAYSLPDAVLTFLRKSSEAWCSKVVVVDRAKSNAAEPALEVLDVLTSGGARSGEAVGPPRRLLYDVTGS